VHRAPGLIVDRHAAGLAALAEGRYLTAYAQLSQLFGAEGMPLHQHVSCLGIAGRHQLRDLIDRVGEQPAPSGGD
jgi:hypothetical protein